MIAIFVVLGTAYDLIIYQPALEAVETTTKVVSKHADIQSKAGVPQGSEINPFQKSNKEEIVKNKNDLIAVLNIYEKIILSFSWYTNFNQVFTLDPPPGVLMPIIGIRLVCIFLLVR